MHVATSNLATVTVDVYFSQIRLGSTLSGREKPSNLGQLKH